MNAWTRILATLGSLLLVACQQHTERQGTAPAYSPDPPELTRVYTIGVHPLYNPQRLAEVFTPLTTYLNQRLPGSTFLLEASKDYADYNNKLRNNVFDFALPNPYQTILASVNGYRIIAKMAPDDDFRGILITRKDAPYELPQELRGTAISFPAPSAVAATMMPQWFLHEHGLKPHQDYRVQYVGSQESSILAVANGLVQAAATWPPPWRQFQADHPELAERLTLRWQTQPLPNNGFVARGTLPEAFVTRVQSALIGMHETRDGRDALSIMRTERFDAADRRTYEPVADFISRFENQLRPAEQP